MRKINPFCQLIKKDDETLTTGLKTGSGGLVGEGEGVFAGVRIGDEVGTGLEDVGVGDGMGMGLEEFGAG